MQSREKEKVREEDNKNSGIFYILVTFLITVFVISVFYSLNIKTKESILNQINTFSLNEGKTVNEMMNVILIHFIKNDEKEFVSFFKKLSENSIIIFSAITKNEKIIFASTKYEDYLPLYVEYKNGVSIINSPIGKILSVKTTVKKGEDLYSVYIGYDLSIANRIISYSEKRFLLVAVVQIVLVVIFLLIILSINKKILKKQIEFLKEKEEKERFKELLVLSSGITHEIKNPLNSIYLAFQLLEPNIKSDDENVNYYRQAIKKEIRRLSDIVTSYAEVLRELKVKKDVVKFSEIKEELEFYSKTGFVNAEIRIEKNLKKDVEFFSSKELLKQVLLNLIKNAYEADATLIKVFFEFKKDRLNIFVEDNGRGISDKEKDKIFNPFFSSKSKGMGIGLLLVKKMITSLSGKVSLIESSKGRTVFLIELPSDCREVEE